MKNHPLTSESERLLESFSVSTSRPKLLRKKPESLPKIDLSKLESFNGQ